MTAQAVRVLFEATVTPFDDMAATDQPEYWTDRIVGALNLSGIVTVHRAELLPGEEGGRG